MAVWESRRLQDSIRQNQFGPLYLLHGEETFLMTEAQHQLADAALGGAVRDFNLNIFYGGDDEVSVIRDAVETFPSFAERRVVVVREAQDFKAKDFEALMPLIERPVESTTLIFMFSKVDQRLKFIKLFKENGVMVNFPRPNENEIPAWIQNIAKRHKKEITQGAAEKVHQLVGTNLMDIDQELQKLAQYCGQKTKIEEEDVTAIVSAHRTESVFELTDAIGSSDRAGALTCLAGLLDQEENPIGIVTLVARHFRILNTLKMGIERGLTSAQLGARVGVPPFFIRKYMDQSKRWDRRKLETVQQALLQTDRALKSSPVAPHIWLENFIIKTCS